MRTSNGQVRLWAMMAAALAFAFTTGCSDDNGGGGNNDAAVDGGGDMTPDEGGDMTPDMTPDMEPDMLPDAEPDMVPDMVADEGGDMMIPTDECLGDTTELGANDGALQVALGTAIALCGRGSQCVSCALGVTSSCGGVADTTSDNYVDCSDTSVPDEECTLGACIGRCIAENSFGDCSSADCDPGETCGDDDICHLDAATAVNDSSLSTGCLDCFTGITQCIAEQGCSASCLGSDCTCDTCQCENDCVSGFVTCSGLPPTVDCTTPPADAAACVTSGEPNGTCDDTNTSIDSCWVSQ